ncbi:MAG: type II toxin-antitoxin system PemK/MazF family toxin [Defluviitaleaceae bacterium]|nr:type II toxin-antitoxin system PemK/MazF family toxin [Defluviitaleaceae bacterium]MCL2262932.1 type II toxin-antitoxin system PemK/MazF family toxin [Defluviitaleaceae bacterium]
MNPYDLHIAYVAWSSDGKRRPVLVLSSTQNEAAVFQITSQYDSKSAAIQAQYIAIDDWAQAGLAKQSYIDIGRIIDLPIATIQSAPIGKLSEKDLRKLLAILNY